MGAGSGPLSTFNGLRPSPSKGGFMSQLNGTILTRYTNERTKETTIFLPLPVSEWRLAGDGNCGCDVCKSDEGRTLAFWDTLTISAKPPKKGHNDYASVCHHPGLHSEYKRLEATQESYRARLEYIAAHLA
jgi:hypothetical protein